MVIIPAWWWKAPARTSSWAKSRSSREARSSAPTTTPTSIPETKVSIWFWDPQTGWVPIRVPFPSLHSSLWGGDDYNGLVFGWLCYWILCVWWHARQASREGIFLIVSFDRMVSTSNWFDLICFCLRALPLGFKSKWRKNRRRKGKENEKRSGINFGYVRDALRRSWRQEYVIVLLIQFFFFFSIAWL